MVADLDTSLSPEPGEDKTAQKAEISRGRREFRQHLPALRERFPLVFPEDIKAVKPLHHSVTAAVAQAMGWTFPFARGVVKGYKLSIPYCHAVLRHRERIGPDGEPVAGSTVDDADRFSARCRIDDFARHRKERREREQAQASGVPIPHQTRFRSCRRQFRRPSLPTSRTPSRFLRRPCSRQGRSVRS